ncbi:MAG: autoinducer-2 kinase [Epsilonproteobacteria bacterium]|nr:autoinducer-2 kinase [Campylobacterota bacterium]
MSYLMTIDAGTGSARAVIFDEFGNQIGVGQEEWEHYSEVGVENSMNFDYRANWGLICRCIKKSILEAKIDADEIKAVTASSMREGIVLYDKFDNEIWAVANVDARAYKEVKELKERFPHIEEQFYMESGQTFALGAIPRLLWLKNNEPQTYEKVAKISMISDWVLARLSGVIATEPSNAGTTGIFNLQNRQWATHQAKEVGLKDDIFPPVYEPSTIIGEITQRASIESGLKEGTAVVMGGGDVQLGSAGLGVIHEGEIAVLGGSFWQQVVNIPSSTLPPEDMSIRVNPHVIKGLSQAEGITFFSGLVMRWFRDAFCDIEKIEAKKRGVDVYSILEEKAKEVPVGSHGIMPIFSDAMKYGKWYHASPSFINLSIDADICNRASMFRSLEENACIVSSINLENISKFSGVNSDTITFASGASKGALWSQILADVTGKRVKIPVVKEATSLGGAMLCGVATGIYKDIQEASSNIVKWDREYEPDMQNHKRYNKIKDKWQEIYKTQLELVDRGLTNSMWKAPGV